MGKNNPKAGAEQIEQERNDAANKNASEQSTIITPSSAPEQAPAASTESATTTDTANISQAKDTAGTEEKTQDTATVVEAPVVAAIAPTSAPVASAAANVAVVKTAAVVVESPEPAKGVTLKDKLASVLKNVPAVYQSEITRIIAYTEAMAPGKAITNKDGAKQQVALYRAIQNIINRQEQYFTQLYSALLVLFKENSKGALGDRYRLRFMESVELAEGDRKAFMNITHVLFATAEPASRANVLKSINMERALQNGLTSEGRDRVLNYYNL